MADRPLIVLTCILCWCIAQSHTLTVGDSNNTTLNGTSPLEDEYKCKDGLFMPKWTPSKNIALGDRVARACVYFIAMFYMFLGVSVIADRFMSSIEVITAKEKEITINKPNGETVKLRVKIWNETVSNLTLMALGSSAPEIMLTAIEIIGKDFRAGDLGPGTIVGSAAFNLFIIIALCIFIIPDGEVRRIKHLRVFFVTATWSIAAYLWLYLIVATISPGVITILEGVITLLLFPLTVGTSFFADKYLLKVGFAKRAKNYRPSRHHNVMIEMEGETDIESATQKHSLHASQSKGTHAVLMAEGQALTEEILQFEEHRKEYIDIVRELRKKHPSMKMKSLENLAEVEVTNRGPKSRAFYRIQATRKLTGGGDLLKTKSDKAKSEFTHSADTVEKKATTVVFEPAHYTVMENVGSFNVTIKRQGGNLKSTVYVDYFTEDGSANVGSDYESAKGTLTFHPNETEKVVSIAIIDDDIYEEDEHFYVKLGNLKYSIGDSGRKLDGGSDKDVMLGTPAVATVMILDDDHAGVFHFEEETHNAAESVGVCHIKVTRSTGARGTVRVPYKTYNGTAKAGTDYTAAEGQLVFANNEYQKYISILVSDKETYERNASFTLELGEPALLRSARGSTVSEAIRLARDPNNMIEEERVAEMGKPRLGEISKVGINIHESEEFKKTVDKLLDRGNTGFILGTSSWVEQFKDALTVSAGEEDKSEEDGDRDEKEKLPSCGDHVMHYLSLFWKLLFATVPPTDYGGGWWCFGISIAWIGILTGIIGDLASSFGCTIRLKDSVTAVTFVALGTSVPDTFASKVAAVGDRYADSSVGNVTGSNAVNVFLGIGVAWTLAAVVNAARGETFTMKQGSLAFSLTIFCAFAITAILLLLVRRSRFAGGELGGPLLPKVISAAYLVLLWIMYVTLSSLEAYGVISGF